MPVTLEQSNQARTTIWRFIEGEREFIERWLSQPGDDWDVGLDITIAEGEAFLLEKDPAERKACAQRLDIMIRCWPGGVDAARAIIAGLVSTGQKVPAELKGVHLDLLRGNLSEEKRRGPKRKNGRRDMLFLVLLIQLKQLFKLPLFKNDADIDDLEMPEYAMEIIVEEFTPLIPELKKVSVKSVLNSVRKFEKKYFLSLAYREST
ncbi:hypothetical protein N8524_09720 [Candidatus Puniceispirillum sp.]|nr:hypothetical protein [Candidatus Puniceispirillum sp.]